MAWLLSAFTDEAGDSCEAQIEAAQNNGLRRLDLRGMDGFSCVTLPLEHARGLAEKLKAANLEVGMFGSPIGKIDIADDVAIDVQKLEHLAALAPILGCRAVRIFSYYNKENRPHDDWRDESLSRLQTLKDRAKELGMILYHENERHIFGDLCVDVLEIAKLRDGETLRTIFDFDNYNQSGDDVWDNWTKLRDATDAIHLKDSTKDNEHVKKGFDTTSCYAKRIIAERIRLKSDINQAPRVRQICFPGTHFLCYAFAPVSPTLPMHRIVKISETKQRSPRRIERRMGRADSALCDSDSTRNFLD